MGWIHFDPRNKELFEIMPSIDRLFTMYSYEIHNIDRLIDETNSIEERTGGLIRWRKATANNDPTLNYQT
jgi:hypothetical protein